MIKECFMQTTAIAAASLLLAAGSGVARTSQGEASSPSGSQSQLHQAGSQSRFSQGRQSRLHQVSGTVLRHKDVTIQTMGMQGAQQTGQEEKNLVVLLQTDQGRRMVVDLGSKQPLQGANIRQGTQMQVQGRMARIGDRPVLLARQASIDGQTVQIERPKRSRLRQVTGQVMRQKQVRSRGSDAKNQVVLLQTEGGRQLIVDLGPAQRLQGMQVQAGDQMTVQGRPTRIGQHLVLMAHQVRLDGQTVQIDRPQGQHWQGRQAQRQQRQATMRQAHQGRMPTRINVTSASALIGRPVVDNQGQDAGEIDYLMIDTETGAVQYALIGSGGFLDIGEEFVAVPWSAIEYGRQTIRVNADRAKLEQAPRYTQDQLSELTQPLVATTVIDYYAVPQQQGEQRWQQQQSQQRSQAQQDWQTRQRRQARQQAQQGQQGQQAWQGQQREQGQQTQQQAQDSRPQILVARDYFTLLAPPTFLSVDNLQGLEVADAAGQDIGDIDKVMIDPDHGYVAYVLLDQGGFLGVGGDWLAAPFTALKWSYDDARFRLNVTEAQLQNMQQLSRLPQEELPSRVRASQLEELYSRFGETPYWQQIARTTPVVSQQRQQQQQQQQQQQRGAMTATVQDVDRQQNRLTLRTTQGETIELSVSEDLLANLEAGDTVRVSIQPEQGAQQSGQSGQWQSGGGRSR